MKTHKVGADVNLSGLGDKRSQRVGVALLGQAVLSPTFPHGHQTGSMMI